jgi:hypothetical protein
LLALVAVSCATSPPPTRSRYERAHPHDERAGDVEGTVLIRDGWIVAVGSRVRVPANATVIDAKGGAVTPGFFVVGTDLGALEVDQVKQTNDTATTNSGLSAAFNIAYGIDASSVTIPVARLGGVTRALITPFYADAEDRELLFAGQAAIITLAEGATPVTRSRVAMVLELAKAGQPAPAAPAAPQSPRFAPTSTTYVCMRAAAAPTTTAARANCASRNRIWTHLSPSSVAACR